MLRFYVAPNKKGEKEKFKKGEKKVVHSESGKYDRIGRETHPSRKRASNVATNSNKHDQLSLLFLLGSHTDIHTHTHLIHLSDTMRTP